MSHDDGWWQVDFVSEEPGGEQLLVSSPHWGTQHLVDKAALRPGWAWSSISNEWSTRGPAAKGGRAGGRGAGPGRGRGRG